MSDLKKYIAKRKLRDRAFARNYDSGYEDFKIGATLRVARERAGLTQEELARKLGTKKSAISESKIMQRIFDSLRSGTLQKLSAESFRSK